MKVTQVTAGFGRGIVETGEGGSGMTRAAMQIPLIAPTMTRTAFVSGDGLYRYELTRTWDESRAGVCFVMLNPSTADDREDDPTIRRCIGFACRWGFGSLVVVNLSPFRASDPREMLLHRHSSEAWASNRWSIKSRSRDAAMTVLAWGALPAGKNMWLTYGMDIEWDAARCLGLTKCRHPRHPLYVRGDASPLSWGEELDRVRTLARSVGEAS